MHSEPEDARDPGYLKRHALASTYAHVVLDHVAEYLLQSSSPQPYIFEGEALGYKEYFSMKKLMLAARKDLANMCLVHSSWLASAQRVLQRRLVFRSYRGIDALISSEYPAEWTSSLRFGMAFGEWEVRPLVNLLACTSRLRLLSIDLRNLVQDKEDVLSAEMTSLADAIGQLKCLEGLIVFNISAAISRVFLKPILFAIRELRELRYIGLGFHSFEERGEPPVVTFSAEEIAEYYNPPKLNVVAVWVELLVFPESFIDHHRMYIPGSGPDVFELKTLPIGYKGLSLTLLANTFMGILKSKRLFVLSLRLGETLSPLIEELFLMFSWQYPSDSQLFQLLSNGLPRLRSVVLFNTTHTVEDEEFPLSSALCLKRNCSLEIIRLPGDGSGRTDELLSHARSMV